MTLRLPSSSGSKPLAPTRVSSVPEYLSHTGTGQGLGVLGRLVPDRFQDAPPAGPTPLADPRPSLGGYLKEQAAMFDPRTPEGMFNLAMALVPGGGKLPLRYRAAADLATLQHNAGERLKGGTTLFSGDMSPARYAAAAIGPRVTGGVYKSGYSGVPYRVLDIRREPGEGSGWQIKIEAVDPTHPNAGAWRYGPVWHSTAWDWKRDRVVWQPPGARSEAERYVSDLLGQRYDPRYHGPGSG